MLRRRSGAAATCWLGAAAIAWQVFGTTACSAQEQTPAAFSVFGHPGGFGETSTGLDVTSRAWSAHITGTYAPFGSIRDAGPRVRLGSTYGQYRYSALERAGRALAERTIHGEGYLNEALAGYQIGWGSLTLKAFAGIAYSGHGIDRFDPGYEVAGGAIGFKAALETWLELGKLGFAQLDASWTRAHDIYAARLRLGYRLLPHVSVGLEGGLNGNVEHGSGKGGGFVRYEWAGGELSAAAGMSGDLSDQRTPYASFSILFRY